MIFILVLVVSLGFASSCGVTGYQRYEGPERPLEEVAVLFEKPPAYLQKLQAVDEQKDGVTITLIKGNTPPGSSWGFLRSWETEHHLEPGRYKVTSLYFTAGASWKSIGSPISLSHHFDKGHVYRLEATLTHDTFGMSRWRPKIIYVGTVEEVAPRRAKEWFSPTHWRKLAERQPRTRSRKDEK